MSIELLWIVPIVAAALLVLVIALNLQKREGASDDDSLRRQVDAYNQGNVEEKQIITKATSSSESRLRDIENTIQLVSTALSNQQKIIENFQGKDVTLEIKLGELKEKLQELQREYDITISENYSLRARLRKLEKFEDDTSAATNVFSEDTDAIERSKVLNIKILDENSEQASKRSSFEDTSEINVSELR